MPDGAQLMVALRQAGRSRRPYSLGVFGRPIGNITVLDPKGTVTCDRIPSDAG